MFVVLKSKFNGKYLRRISEEYGIEKELPQTFLNFLGDDITSPVVKFELERAKKDAEGVHIRCCHNNKYLAPNGSGWVFASADHPDEEEGDQNTLFKLVKTQIDEQEYFKIQHVGLKYFAQILVTDNNHSSGLFMCPKEIPHPNDAFKVLDWDSLVIFPKNVALRSNLNNQKYVSPRVFNTYPFLQFDAEEIADQTVVNEISTFSDGFVRIKNLSTKNYWRRGDGDWIYNDHPEAKDDDLGYLFWPIKLGDNIVALKNMGSSYFCEKFSEGDVESCVKAGAKSITNEAKLCVSSSSMLRSIYGILFREEDGRVYNLNKVYIDEIVADNPEDIENTLTIKFSYKKKSSSNFTNSVSFKLDVKPTLHIDAIPVIVDGKIEISADVGGNIEWEKPDTVETLTKATFTAKAPPNTTTKFTLVAIQGTCEVPFSYIQREILYNGDTVIQTMEDGIYTGVNMFNFEISSSQYKPPAV
ncbi:uncharacterized protein LOC115719775 [Cannabis sativa]|uniref:Agglutinin domain-containing protein n=1 Tax=Cannabis sativa TaxID=3483 RepID=A0A7J6G9Z5_CANSA|nr:uncharacterized protein LOC115719775 [Cannabis sativa]KAF4379642.1 hypothetical protein F8388_023659 [Cannabis sativa]